MKQCVFRRIEKAEKPRSVLHREKESQRSQLTPNASHSTEESDPEEDDDTITCPVCCKRGYCRDALWICCDVWYHAECTDISPDDYDDLGSIE